MALGAFALAAVLLASVPASARDVGELSCPVDGLSIAERPPLIAYTLEQTSNEDPRAVPLVRSTRACQARFGWSDDAASFAIMHAFAVLAEAEFRVRLAGHGVDPAVVERAILADPALIAGARNGGTATEQARPFLRELMPQVQRFRPPFTAELLSDLGHYIAFRTALEATRLDFAAQ